jgi:hypothetical protein
MARSRKKPFILALALVGIGAAIVFSIQRAQAPTPAPALEPALAQLDPDVADVLESEVGALLERAQIAMEKKDYQRAEVEAWNAYELDRNKAEARSLYQAARASRYEQAAASARSSVKKPLDYTFTWRSAERATRSPTDMEAEALFPTSAMAR